MTNSFDNFLSQLSKTNSTLDYFVDFDKVSKNISKINIKLNQLNYLIGQEDLKQAIKELYLENPNCFSVLGIIIAVRENRPVLNDSGNVVMLKDYFNTSDSIYEFMQKTGLSEVFKDRKIKNIVDYVFGIEVGLDTNARKNRGGKNMEKSISKIFRNNQIPFKREVKHTKFSELKDFGIDVKRFDFMIKTKENTYLIETNFYNSGGSKLNEIARSYTDLAPKVNKYKNFQFVWITDGQGWLHAKNKLEEAFTHIPHLYNLKSLPLFLEKIKKEL